MTAEDRKWRAESALRTLTEADRIRSDRGLMADVKKQATQQVKTLSKVAAAPSKGPAKKR
jgi:hypothetical protein